MALLRACFQSREVYLEEYPHSLAMCYQDSSKEPPSSSTLDNDDDPDLEWQKSFGNLHFGPRDTFIFSDAISFNYSDESYHEVIWPYLTAQSWAKDITSLTLNERAFCTFDLNAWSTFFACFTGLKRLELLLDWDYDHVHNHR